MTGFYEPKRSRITEKLQEKERYSISEDKREAKKAGQEGRIQTTMTQKSQFYPLVGRGAAKDFREGKEEDSFCVGNRLLSQQTGDRRGKRRGPDRLLGGPLQESLPSLFKRHLFRQFLPGHLIENFAFLITSPHISFPPYLLNSFLFSTHQFLTPTSHFPYLY